jgi:hypothetical protein
MLFATLTLLIGFPAIAHHNGATYFDTSVALEHNDATVVSYDLVNPHGRLVYIFMDDAGNEVQWSAELPSANNARRRGLGGELFKPGDRLAAITGSPSRSGSNSMRLTRVVFTNGDVAQITGRNAGVIRAGTD